MKLKKQKLAEVVRSRREAEGLTQTDLSEKSGISLRSIQRIEKGEVLPRPFTLKALQNVLKFSGEDLLPQNEGDHSEPTVNKAQKIILSVGLLFILILLAIAFLAQSQNFPETSFELALYWVTVISLIGLVQWRIWADKK